jgi:NADPH:quinone reductase-like Zn-dependent oxidoreductase
MKAVVNRSYGGTEVLEYTEVAKPAPKDHEIRVRVKAASINSWDWDYLRGEPKVFRLLFGILSPKHTILGCDISGVVESVGRNGKRLKVGDEVYGDLSAYNWGGFGEYAASHEDAWALKPKNLTFEESAAAPQAGVLALQGLRWNGELGSDQHVLINGAGGGVGTYGIQLAKLAGCEVTVVDKVEKLDALRKLGADHVIDMKRDFTLSGEQYDLILDNAARRSPKDYLRALKPDGAMVMVGGAVSLMLKAALFGNRFGRKENKKIGILVHRPNVQDLDHLTKLFEEGKLRSVVDSVFELSETREAFEHYVNDPFVGKIVVTQNDTI